jgi:predicted HNH restriction endonuclease
MCYHHVKTRKSGGTDEPHNLMPLCAWCHVEIHKIGLVSMSQKYESVNNWLINNGWEVMMGKWFHS